MLSLLAFLSYGIAVAIAFALSTTARALRWYWYTLSVVCAFVIGFIRFPPGWSGPILDIAIGSTFVFLFTFGLVGLIARFVMPKEDRHGCTKHA
jgi:hypothetical protein